MTNEVSPTIRKVVRRLVTERPALLDNPAAAGERKHICAAFRLGLMYRDGNGVEQSARQAAAWFRVAAEEGSAEGALEYAGCLAEGNGIAADPAEALEWYIFAAERGNADAALRAADAYAAGEGTDINLDEAEKWSRLAAERGNSEGALEDAGCLAAKMGDAEGAPVEKLTLTWTLSGMTGGIIVLGVTYLMLLLKLGSFGHFILLFVPLLAWNAYKTPTCTEIDFREGEITRRYRRFASRCSRPYSMSDFSSVRSYLEYGVGSMNVVELVHHSGHAVLRLIEYDPKRVAKSFFSVPYSVESDEAKRLREILSSRCNLEDEGYQGERSSNLTEF